MIDPNLVNWCASPLEGFALVWLVLFLDLYPLRLLRLDGCWQSGVFFALVCPKVLVDMAKWQQNGSKMAAKWQQNGSKIT
jgi:hypothetical protein